MVANDCSRVAVESSHCRCPRHDWDVVRSFHWHSRDDASTSHYVIDLSRGRRDFSQWSFLVPLIGGRYHIITQLAIYKWYISGILPIWGLYGTYHLLREPETTIDSAIGLQLFLCGEKWLVKTKIGCKKGGLVSLVCILDLYICKWYMYTLQYKYI